MGTGQPNILVIDDDVRDQELIGKFLGDAGFQSLDFATSGDEGLQKVRSKKPDIIVTDTRLPDVEGFEVCRRIREIKSYRPKIVVMTGVVEAVDVTRAREAGADDSVVKTADYGLLIHVLKDLSSR